MSRRLARLAAAFLVAAACEESTEPPPGFVVTVTAGDLQTDTVGQVLAPYVVTVTDTSGAPAPGMTVVWSVTLGVGSVQPESTTTDALGVTSATRTLGTLVGSNRAQALVAGVSATFAATAVAGAPASLTIVSGNGQTGSPGLPAPAPYVVRARDQYNNVTPGVEVLWTARPGQGTLSAPADTTDAAGAASVVHTLPATPGPDTVVASVSGVAPVTFVTNGVLGPTLVATIPVAANYGLHDTFVRDGIAFLFAWNSGVLIYDVGNGAQGGTPAVPAFVGSVVTGTSGLSCSCVHNGWWFHNPGNGDKKYLFIGQEGPSSGGAASGDIHVVDVTNLAAPVEVATYHLAGAGVHNFWMDEAAGVLFAAYYNGGVVALDVSGTLTGNLASRELAKIQPGGAANTFTWGVMQANGAIYAADMLSGLWRLTFNGTAFATGGGGNNVAERYTSDLWVHGGYAYTGTWGLRSELGNAVKIWQLNMSGAPVLVDSIVVTSGAVTAGTISDIEVSSDGKLLVFSVENGNNGAINGVYVYGLADPRRPNFLGHYAVSTGVHTASLATIGGKR